MASAAFYWEISGSGEEHSKDDLYLFFNGFESAGMRK